jgi:hypothetical protein
VGYGIKLRLSHTQWTLKPQDLAMAFKLVSLKGGMLPYAALAKLMCISQFEAHACVTRLTASRLLADVEGVPRLVMPAFKSFVMLGAPYFFPAVRGEITMGLPTAHGVEPLRSHVMFGDELPPVWPHAQGHTRGTTLLPLYPKLPMAAALDKNLYELLALFDSLRIGQAREREIVRGLMEERLV